MNKEPDRNPRKALGKGLSALLPNRTAAHPLGAPQPQPSTVPVASFKPEAPASPINLPENSEEFQSIPLEQIEPGDQQPRDRFDDEKLQELAQSIKAHGVIQPITVRKTGSQQFRIVAGERRWRAARLAGLNAIPSLVRIVKTDDLLELALIENIQREDLNPIEIAQAFQQLIDEHRLSHEQIAERTGKDRSTVTNFLRLLKLSAAARQLLVDGEITMGHARALLSLDASAQADACAEIKKHQFSVRQTEALVKHLTERGQASSPPDAPAKPEPEPLDPNVRSALEDISRALGTRVKLVPRSETSGRLEIEYYSQEDLDRIYSVITAQ